MKFLILAIFLVFYLNSAIADDRKTSFSEKPNCEKNDGVWRQFGNSCADNCKSKFDKFLICAQAITYGCDCLNGRCYDEGQCVLTSEYKEKYDKIKKEESEILELQKAERKDKFLTNRQIILRKLTTPMGTDGKTVNNKVENNLANNHLQNGQNLINQTINDPNIYNSPNYIANPVPTVSPSINIDDNFQVPPFFTQAQDIAIKEIEEQEKLKKQARDNLSLPIVPIN